jgi:OB-fold nucleic acid binding domain
VDANNVVLKDTKIGSPLNIEEIIAGGKPSLIDHTASDSSAFSSGPSKIIPSSNPYKVLTPSHTDNISTSSKPASVTNNPYDQRSSSDSMSKPHSHSTPAHPNAPTSSLIQPISSLSPYQNQWMIMARVTSKQDIKTWTNSRGDGKLFSINLIDDSGEIRATAFNESVTMFYPLFEVGKIYTISMGQVKLAKRQFSNVDNDYEIHLDKESLVIWVCCCNSICLLEFDCFFSRSQKMERVRYQLFDINLFL